jgi:hypothetical protein
LERSQQGFRSLLMAAASIAEPACAALTLVNSAAFRKP